MPHFSLEKWADFANQKVSAAERELMERHLKTDCSQCNEVVAKWQSLKHFAAQESHNEAPENVVTFVKNTFKTLNLHRKPGIVAMLAQLVFDSFRQPAIAGIRSGSLDSRCLLYKAGSIMIDLNLNWAHKSGHLALQGQVMGSEPEAKGIEEVPIVLQSGKETIASTQTNKLGEFELECEVRKDLQISVGVNPQKNVLIVLDENVWNVPPIA